MQLPEQVKDERSWRSSLSNVKEHYSDSDVPLSNFIVNFFKFIISKINFF